MQFSFTAALVAVLAVANAAGHKDDKITIYSWKNHQCAATPSQSTLLFKTCKKLPQASKSIVFPNKKRTIPKNCFVNGYAKDNCKGDIAIQITAPADPTTCFQLPSTIESVEFLCG